MTTEIRPISQIAKPGDKHAGRGSSDGTHLSIPITTAGVATLSKLSINGTLLWERSLSNGGSGSTTSVAPDGTILVASSSGGTAGKMSALARFSSTANKLWEVTKTYPDFADIAVSGNTVCGGRIECLPAMSIGAGRAGPGVVALGTAFRITPLRTNRIRRNPQHAHRPRRHSHLRQKSTKYLQSPKVEAQTGKLSTLTILSMTNKH